MEDGGVEVQLQELCCLDGRCLLIKNWRLGSNVISHFLCQNSNKTFPEKIRAKPWQGNSWLPAKTILFWSWRSWINFPFQIKLNHHKKSGEIKYKRWDTEKILLIDFNEIFSDLLMSFKFICSFNLRKLKTETIMISVILWWTSGNPHSMPQLFTLLIKHADVLGQYKSLLFIKRRNTLVLSRVN